MLRSREALRGKTRHVGRERASRLASLGAPFFVRRLVSSGEGEGWGLGLASGARGDRGPNPNPDPNATPSPILPLPLTW